MGTRIRPSQISQTAPGLLGASATGDTGLITLGTNLSFSGSTLNASGGGGLPPDAVYGDITVSASGATWTVTQSILAALRALTGAADKGIHFTSASTAATHDLTAYGRSLLAGANAAAVRTTLGLGTLATQNGTFSGTSSGTNTGDQTITLTGPITGSGTGSISTTIAPSSVDFSMMQDMNAGDLLGRGAASGDGPPEPITIGAGLTLTGTTLSADGGGTVADGDYGDITVSSGGANWNIDANTVGLTELADLPADRILGRDSSGSGDPQQLTCTAAGRAILDDASASDQRTTLGLGTLATQNGTFSGTSSGTNTGDQTITLTGDVTGSGTGSFAATIAANAVTLARMAQMATASLLGRNTAGTGDPEVLSTATVKTMLNLTGTNSGDQTITLTGDVTGSGTGSFATTIAALAVTDSKVAAANKDGASGTPSMRTLGTGASQACAGNDSRLSDSRAPSGTAGGDLTSTYPNPEVAKVAKSLTLSGVITPTALAADTNDYAPTGFADASVVRISASTPVNVTGLAGGATGRFVILLNAGGSVITLTHFNALSASANKFYIPNLVGMKLARGQAALLYYNVVWNVLSVSEAGMSGQPGTVVLDGKAANVLDGAGKTSSLLGKTLSLSSAFN